MNDNKLTDKQTVLVNALNLAGVRRAIALAEANLAALKPEARAGTESALEALREREQRLVETRRRFAGIKEGE